MIRNVTDLSLVKQVKKAEKVLEDFAMIEKVLDLTRRSLVNFQHYVAVTDTLQSVAQNLSILNAHKKRFQRIVDEHKNGRLEKA